MLNTVVGTSDMDDTVPYTEEELATLYPNPQLDVNERFIDQFIKVMCVCVLLVIVCPVCQCVHVFCLSVCTCVLFVSVYMCSVCQCMHVFC